MEKIIARILLAFLLLNLLPIGVFNNTYAVDSDLTANLNLTLNSTVIPSSIVGNNFSLDFSLRNEGTSEGDAFNPGFIINLPEDVSFVSSSDLGTPTRTVNNLDGTTSLFFKTSDLLVKTTINSYSINLKSETDAILFTPTDIKVLAYAEDNIYGRGSVPVGAPGGTLPGGVDMANTTTDPINTFPDNVNGTTDLTTLPFNSTITQFIPFDVKKTGVSPSLIGKPTTTTLTIYGNDLGQLKDFHLSDVIPNNRKFIGFTQTGSIGSINVLYNTPSAGEVTLDLDGIDVNISSNLEIKYQTLPLAFPISSYTGSTIILNTGSVISDRTNSVNTVTMLPEGTWNDGNIDIAITPLTVVVPQNFDANLGYAALSKSANKSIAEIGDIVRYTITLDLARNISFGTGGVGTSITDILPDGLAFSGIVSNVNSGVGNNLANFSTGANVNFDTILTWSLNSGEIVADDTVTIVYDAIVDGDFSGGGELDFENTESLTNTATFIGTISNSTNNEEWGFTDLSIIGTTVSYSDSATITAPNPTNDKRLISVEFPDATIYDSNTPLPANTPLPVGSKLKFAVIMDFPNTISTGAIIKDALPLLTGPNESVYNIEFQTNTGLLDMYGVPVPFNDDDGTGTPTGSFNGQTLGGTNPGDTAWITTSPANNIEFSLGGGNGKKTFSMTFMADILPTEPSGYNNEGILPEKNVSIASFKDDLGTVNNLEIIDLPFDIALPALEITKSSSGTSLVYGNGVDYTVLIENTGEASAYAENIIDTIPSDMLLDSWDIVFSGSSSTVTNSSVTQSGTTLNIEFNTGATSPNRSVISKDLTITPTVDESNVILTYTLKPTSSFVIRAGETRTNTIELDYYSTPDAPSDGVNNFGPINDTSDFTVGTPTITRTLFSSSEGYTNDDNLLIGEEVTFETIITLPGGTYPLSSFIEDLYTSQLEFLSGSVISTGPNLSFSTGTGFTSNTIAFGDIINSSTTPETIVIHTNARVRNTASRGNNRRAEGEFHYSGTSVTRNSSVDIFMPTLNLQKLVTPSTADAGDIITYTLNVSHNSSSNAPAYDLVLKDVIAGLNLLYTPGSLTGATNFVGTENDLFGGTGLLLPMLDLGNSESITFNATVLTGAIAGTQERNNLTLAYSSLDDDASIYERNFSASTYVDLNISDLSISHSITSTTNSGTTSSRFTGTYPDLTIGEELTYRILAPIPELGINSYSITQDIPAGLKFLTGSVIFNGVKIHTINTISIPQDNKITFDFGDIDNIGLGTGTGFILETEVVVLDNPANSAGSIKNSIVTAEYDTTNSKTESNPNFDIVEPNLIITKNYTPNLGDAGDNISTTITIENNGSAPAYGVSWIDLLPNKTTSSGGFLATSSTGVLNIGDIITYTYDTVLQNTVSYGDVLTGTASVNYSSYPLDPIEGERSYSGSNTDTITVVTTSGVSKTLESSSIVKIGDVVSYKLQVPVLEGTTDNLTITDTIPAGFAILTGSININTSAGVSYSGSVTPITTPTSETITLGQEQSIVYNFVTVVNSDTDNGSTDYITIDYNVVALNSSDNNDGNIKSEGIEANYNLGTTILTGAVMPATIYEPNLSLAVSSVYTNGYNAIYNFTVENTGNVSAYDLDIQSLLPLGLTFTGGITITNQGTAINVIKIGDNFTIQELPVNTANPLQFNLAGIIAETVNNNDSLTLTGNLTYTSKSGNYTSLVSNVLNTERNGSNIGVDDYLDSDNDTITVTLAILNEDISVVDINGGEGIIGDIFEYTITLINSGSVDLTNIEVDLPISSSFTGFTVVLTPVGSTDNSTFTGGLNNAGTLAFSGITLNIGETKTIVYRVTAKDTVPDLTTVNTVANVSDTPEGALGGLPNVPVTIHAPIFVTDIIELDDNGSSLYQNEGITHNFSIENVGSATGNLVNVSIIFSTGATYLSGSLSYGTGSKINTGSIVVNSASGTINFILTDISPSDLENFSFKTTATGNVGDTIISDINIISIENIGSTSTSNILEIISIPVVSSGGGGGGGSSIILDCINSNLECKLHSSGVYKWYRKSGVSCNNGDLGKVCNIKEEIKKIEEKEKEEKEEEEKIVKEEKKEKEIIKNKYKKPDEKVLIEYIEKYEEKEDLLKKLLEEEELEGESLLKALPSVLPKTGTPISSRIKTLYDKRVNTSLPNANIFRLAGSKNTDINFWLDILPLEDRKYSKYIVLPSNGLVIPINEVSNDAEDYDTMINGREVEVNKYLKTGVVEYPGTSTRGYGEVGNKVVFGHSSYWNSDNGRYKTHFQKIIELDSGEEVWVYEKNESGEYKRYRYIVRKSYDTDKSDTSVLKPGIGKNLTLFTCTPIGGIAGRWIIKAKYIDEVISDLESEVNFSDIAFKYRLSIDNLINKIKSIDNIGTRDKALFMVYNKVEIILEKYKDNKKVYRLFELLKLKLSKEILNNK